MPSPRNPLPRVDGEIFENDRVSSSTATRTCTDRPDLGPGDCLPPIEAPTGEKAKARDIIAAIRTLKTLESEQRPPRYR